MWRTFAEVIERGAMIPYDARQAAFDVRVLEAVEKAIRTGASIPI